MGAGARLTAGAVSRVRGKHKPSAGRTLRGAPARGEQDAEVRLLDGETRENRIVHAPGS